ncbi:MAG: hypothetical protein KJO47_02355, partial [Gammaproteobacteria bacterium]|nr:hypothetical protein [Gammaproteobacteria bacterium]
MSIFRDEEVEISESELAGNLILAGILVAKAAGNNGLKIRAIARSPATRVELEKALKIKLRLI